MGKKDQIKAQGRVVENLSRDNFRVELDCSAEGRLLPTGRKNSITILASLSGKIRQHHIRVMPGDRVELELSAYDLTRGRITRRFQVKQQQ